MTVTNDTLTRPATQAVAFASRPTLEQLRDAAADEMARSGFSPEVIDAALYAPVPAPAPRPAGRTYHATGHCAEQAATERRRALISELLAATGLTPEAAIDIILTNDNVAHNWREAVSL